MTQYTKIQFFDCPTFKDLFEMAKEYYIQYDITANGCYSIILELKGNGKVNRINLHSL